MKCYICLLHPPTAEQLQDRTWPPNAITQVAGTAVCAAHITHIANHMVLSAVGINALPVVDGARAQ